MYDFIVVLRNGEKCLGETARVTGQYLDILAGSSRRDESLLGKAIGSFGPVPTRPRWTTSSGSCVGTVG